MLDERKLDVLRAIVTDYVSSREPVGSKALVERHDLGVSPATVRNDMAVLEEEGYITQPHTSAGRIPTDKGYRLFVDRLGAIKPLSTAERRAIQTFLTGAIDLDDIVSRTVRLLAQVTHQVAIVQYPTLNSATVRHIELVTLTTDRVMLILITSTGQVEQRAIELPGHDPLMLAQLRARLNAVAVGKTPAEAIPALGQLLDRLPAEEVFAGRLAIAALLEQLGADASSRVVVAGVPNLTRYGLEFDTSIRPVLEALEEQVVLLRLLGEATAGDEVTVRIGQELSHTPFHATAMVATAYGGPDAAGASLGVVGPTRMDYPATIAAVRAVARYLSRLLAEG